MTTKKQLIEKQTELLELQTQLIADKLKMEEQLKIAGEQLQQVYKLLTEYNTSLCNAAAIKDFYKSKDLAFYEDISTIYGSKSRKKQNNE